MVKTVTVTYDRLMAYAIARRLCKRGRPAIVMAELEDSKPLYRIVELELDAQID